MQSNSSNSIGSHPSGNLTLRIQWHTGMCHCIPPPELAQICAEGKGKSDVEAVGNFVLKNPTMFGFDQIELLQGPALQA